MNNLFLLCSFSTFIYLIFKTKKSFHMLQQNWYNEDNRYLKWIFHNRKKVFLHYDLLILILFIFCLIYSKLCSQIMGVKFTIFLKV